MLVDELVVTVIVDVPWPVTEVGLKLAVELDGNPRTRNVTVPLNPPVAPTVTVYVVLLPRVTVCEAGETEMVKPWFAGFTTNVTVT